MKTLYRNLASIIRKFKTAYLLNLLGTATAFSAFMLIMMQIHYERGFDKCLDKSENIYRLTSNAEYPFNIILPRGLVNAFVESSPYIEEGGAIADFDIHTYFEADNENGLKSIYKLPLIGIESSVAKVFSFNIIAGTLDCIEAPDKILIPASIAKKVYGTVDVVGRTLKKQDPFWLSDEQMFTIGGVYADFPSNTQVKNTVYCKMNDNQRNEMRASNFSCFFRVKDGADVQDLTDKFNAKIKEQMPENEYQIEAVPIESIYYLNESGEGIFVRCGDKSVSNTLLIIALIIIIISMVNHINFNLALVPMRIRSINTQKVLGCSVSRLRVMLVLESVMVCVVAWLIGLLLVYLAGGTWLTSFLIGDLTIGNNLALCLLTGAGSVVIGLLAGIYPSIIQTSINPAIALKGSFGLSKTGRRLRALLLTVQYVASIAFVASACFVWLQNKHMLAQNSLTTLEQVIQTEVPVKLAQENYKPFIDRLKENPAIMNVAFGQQTVGATDTYTTDTYSSKDGRWVQYQAIFASAEVLDVFGIKVIEGRNFTEPEFEGKGAYAVVTKSFRDASGIEFSDKLYNYGDNSWGELVGIIDNVNVTSMRNETKPMAFVSINEISEETNFTNLFIRLAKGVNIFETTDYITKVFREFIPEFPIEYAFYDDIVGQLYHKERALSSELVFFSILAIIISMIGIFGMVMFDCEYRRKETAVRRVMGASVSDILKLSNTRYLKLLAIGFVVSVPVVVVFISRWLATFVSHISIGGGVFVVVLAIVSAMTMGIVTLQIWNTANENPVNNLKTE